MLRGKGLGRYGHLWIRSNSLFILSSTICIEQSLKPEPLMKIKHRIIFQIKVIPVSLPKSMLVVSSAL